MVKSDKKISLIVICVIFIFTSCKNTLENNSYKTKIEHEIYKVPECNDDNPCKEFGIFFLNNPFGLDASYEILLSVSGYLVYSGSFEKTQGGGVNIPLSILDSKSEVSLCIYRKKDKFGYFYTPKETFFLNKNGKILFITFMPSNAYSERLNIYSQ